MEDSNKQYDESMALIHRKYIEQFELSQIQDYDILEIFFTTVANFSSENKLYLIKKLEAMPVPESSFNEFLQNIIEHGTEQEIRHTLLHLPAYLHDIQNIDKLNQLLQSPLYYVIRIKRFL